MLESAASEAEGEEGEDVLWPLGTFAVPVPCQEESQIDESEPQDEESTEEGESAAAGVAEALERSRTRREERGAARERGGGERLPQGESERERGVGEMGKEGGSSVVGFARQMSRQLARDLSNKQGNEGQGALERGRDGEGVTRPPRGDAREAGRTRDPGSGALGKRSARKHPGSSTMTREDREPIIVESVGLLHDLLRRFPAACHPDILAVRRTVEMSRLWATTHREASRKEARVCRLDLLQCVYEGVGGIESVAMRGGLLMLMWNKTIGPWVTSVVGGVRRLGRAFNLTEAEGG